MYNNLGNVKRLHVTFVNNLNSILSSLGVDYHNSILDGPHKHAFLFAPLLVPYIIPQFEFTASNEHSMPPFKYGLERRLCLGRIAFLMLQV